jgi:hypothetical protein
LLQQVVVVDVDVVEFDSARRFLVAKKSVTIEKNKWLKINHNFLRNLYIYGNLLRTCEIRKRLDSGNYAKYLK